MLDSRKGVTIECGSLGLSMSDRLLLAAFIDLIDLRNGNNFKLGDRTDTNVLFVNDKDAEASAWLTQVPKHVFVVRLGESSAVRSGEYALTMPLLIRPLRAILTDISERMGQRGFNQPVGEESSMTVLAHRKLENLLRLLDQAVHSNLRQAITGIESLHILVLPASQQVAIRSESNWEKLLSESAAQLQLESCPIGNPEGASLLLGLDQFRWRLALHLSHGMLLPALTQRAQFTLMRWPDFGRFGQNPKHLKMSALMVLRTLSVATIAVSTGNTRDDVIAFINACACVQLLKETPERALWDLDQTQTVLPKTQSVSAPVAAGAPSPNVRSGFLGLLGKLRAALNAPQKVK
jgi:hypothetical protein